MKKLTLISIILSALLFIGCNNQTKDETLSDGTFHAVGLNLSGTINVDVTIKDQRIVEVSVLEKLKNYDDVDVMILKELESMFSVLSSVSINGY